ncbi:hypothetical protein R1sor_002363 [Riccia sorocarpa]|uniref:Uncharacterized protein n=1 Tax=Riccia sorocarpa TaxID=122646 RepID=A0ABD3H2S3_9MARC
MSRGADDRYKYSALEPPITLSSDRAEIVNPVDQLRQGISAFEQKDELSASCKRVRRLEETSTTHDVEYNEFEITCLKGSSFSISKAELDDQQLAYRASLYPPISYINIWDEGQRQQAQSNGIMSTIQLKIRGHWTVKPQDDRSLPVTLADYDFLCRRDLIRYERVRTAAAKRSTLGCFGSTSGEVELVEEKIVLRQELPKRFLINHSFSHMDFRLFQQADVYKWDLRTQDYSPVMPLLR